MSTRFSLNSSNLSRRSATGSSEFSCHLPFWGLGFLGRSHQFPGAISPLRSDTEPEYELEARCMLSPAAGSTSLLNESCDGDVEDETLPELAENPGTTRGTKLSVLQTIPLPSLVNRGFRPLTHSQEYPWSSQSLPGDRTAGVSTSNCTVAGRVRS